jgi:hypothetical protein
MRANRVECHHTSAGKGHRHRRVAAGGILEAQESVDLEVGQQADLRPGR